MNPILTQNLSRLWSSIIIDELTKHKVLDFYCAPGMRNAPILASIVKNENAKAYSFFDERSLSYRALGNSKKNHSPVALTCTSGTAMGNFMPAIIEAFKSNLPLIILSADRPVELVKIDANQTINQTDMLKEFCCYTLSLEAPNETLTPKRLRALISTAVGKAKTLKKPVHINIPLREPVDSTIVEISKSYLEKAHESFNNNEATSQTILSNNFNLNKDIMELIKASKSPLLVIGKIDHHQNDQEYISTLKQIKIPKYLDVTSGIKFQFSLRDGLNPSFDHKEVLSAYKKNCPDLIIHVGGRLVSKHYYKFQEEQNETKVIHVTDFDDDHNPGFANSYKLICNPLSFLESLRALELEAHSPISWDDFTQRKRDIIEENELTFPFISKNIIENLEIDTDILVGNSTAVRSFDSFIAIDKSYPATVYSNRGVSGIEGFNATLCGLSDQDSSPKVLVLGDVSFIHDLNSILMLKEKSNKNITIVIVNDFGGGIFEQLPISKEKEYIELLTTPHEFDFQGFLSSLSFLNYNKVFTKQEFLKSYKESLASESVTIIEAIIDKKNNSHVYELLKTLRL